MTWKRCSAEPTWRSPHVYNVLAPTALHRFFEPIRDEYASAVHQVLAIKGCSAILDSDTTLQRSIQLRNPYVDPDEP